MTKQEIELIIYNDTVKMNNAPFPEPLPDWLLTNFEHIIMEHWQNVNPYTSELLKSVLSKRDDPSKLTVMEGGWVLNVLNSVPPILISADVEDFIKKKELFGKIMFNYNLNIKKEEGKLNDKKENLIKGNRKMILT